MAWDFAITLAAIGALVLYHALVATPEPAVEAPAAAATLKQRDPWARVLVAAAVAAALLALGVVLVPAVAGNDEAASTTPPTTTPPTTTPPPTTTTSPTTTTAPTTTSVPSTSTRSTTTTTRSTTRTSTTTRGGPTTTPPTSPPPGSVLIARGHVRPDGTAAQTVNRLSEPFVVRRTAAGEYHISFPGLSDAARRRSAISVRADSSTTPVAGWAANGALVVLLFDKKTGEPKSRAFVVGVSVPEATLPGTR
jgi:hypothetical protein